MKNNYIPISLNYQLRTQFGSLINDIVFYSLKIDEDTMPIREIKLKSYKEQIF